MREPVGRDRTTKGTVLRPNDVGRLSKVSVKLNAENFDDAEGWAYFEASSYLSNLAFELDIPFA